MLSRRCKAVARLPKSFEIGVGTFRETRSPAARSKGSMSVHCLFLAECRSRRFSSCSASILWSSSPALKAVPWFCSCSMPSSAERSISVKAAWAVSGFSEFLVSASTCVFSICSRTVNSAAARFTASSGRSVRSDRQRNWFGTWFDSFFWQAFSEIENTATAHEVGAGMVTGFARPTVGSISGWLCHSKCHSFRML